MKKIFLALIAASLIFGINSCSKQTDGPKISTNPPLTIFDTTWYDNTAGNTHEFFYTPNNTGCIVYDSGSATGIPFSHDCFIIIKNGVSVSTINPDTTTSILLSNGGADLEELLTLRKAAELDTLIMKKIITNPSNGDTISITTSILTLKSY